MVMDLNWNHLEDYAGFLESLRNRIFPNLVQELMRESRRAMERARGGESWQPFSSTLRDLAKALERTEIRDDIDLARGWVLNLSISDADAIWDSLSERITEARLIEHILPGHPHTVVATLRFCILHLADKLDEPTDTNG